jgi:hypothetical protein
MNGDFEKVSSQMASLRSTVESLQKENAQLKSTIAALNKNGNELADLRAQIADLKAQITASSFLNVAAVYASNAKATATKYYKIALTKAGPAMEKAQVQFNKQYVMVKPHVTKASGALAAGLDKSIVYFNKNLPVVRAQLGPVLVKAGVPDVHVPFVATTLITIALMLALTLVLAVVNAVLSLVCCCGRKKHAAAKKAPAAVQSKPTGKGSKK